MLDFFWMVPLPYNKAFLFGGSSNPIWRVQDMDSALHSALQKVEEVNHSSRALVRGRWAFPADP